MKIVLTNEECEKFFYNALCNGLGYVLDYNLELAFSKENYKESRKKLTAPCYEEVLMQMLKDGYSLTMRDHESGEPPRTITLNHVHKRMHDVDAKWLIQMYNEEDDATTADCILQTIFYGEVIFG